jgi:hypothetical protein
MEGAEGLKSYSTVCLSKRFNQHQYDCLIVQDQRSSSALCAHALGIREIEPGRARVESSPSVTLKHNIFGAIECLKKASNGARVKHVTSSLCNALNTGHKGTAEVYIP